GGVICVGQCAGIFLSESKVIERMSKRVVEAKRQAVGRSFPQAEESSMIVGKALVGIPINSGDLSVAENHGTCLETWLEKVPDGTCTMGGPVRIAIILIILGCRRCAGREPGAE